MSDKKKFGLVMPKKIETSKIKKHSVFSEDESDEDHGRHKRPKIPQKKINLKSKLKAEVVEDPSIYEYDNIYDEMKLKQAENITPKEKQKSRYIETLMKAAEKKKKEYERRMDRKIQAEREKEGDKYKDKEAFVTSSYKKKMEELEKEEERERHKDMLNDMMDVSKQKDISGFYRHFLKQTVGEEKVPEFGGNKIKEEILSDDDSSQKFAENAECFKKFDQNSDGVEIDSDNDENKANVKYNTEGKGRKSYSKSQSSHNLAGSPKEYKNLDQDSDGVEIDSSEDEDAKAPNIDNKQRNSSHSLPGSSKNYKNIDEDSDGVEIDSDVDEKHNSDDKGKKYGESSKYDSLISHEGSSDTKSKKGKKREHDSEFLVKSVATQDSRIHYRKRSQSSNSSSSDNEQDASIKQQKDQNKCEKSDKKNNKHSRHDSNSSSSDNSDNENEKISDEDKVDRKSSSEKPPKRNIYVKRTVRTIFSEAQARYFQRMALRDA